MVVAINAIFSLKHHLCKLRNEQALRKGLRIRIIDEKHRVPSTWSTNTCHTLPLICESVQPSVDTGISDIDLFADIVGENCLKNYSS
ncbi:hypothetical protein EG68_01057 [Paragonimus skrjabini miyazakii]|uniref:Uncharacterized protein n=1 Tax=Paragonimus skrjabini miyazakii TaxID=59628 RepID=A0A8S9Z4X9_9TREM|nr:hypothetical protein EG68_01057 [Paragonimus skrjabini miyazakii]